MQFRLPFSRLTAPPPASDPAQAAALWTAWHSAGLIITLVDLGLGSTLFMLHYAVPTILYLLGSVQALALGVIGGLYQLTAKKGP